MLVIAKFVDDAVPETLSPPEIVEEAFDMKPATNRRSVEVEFAFAPPIVEGVNANELKPRSFVKSPSVTSEKSIESSSIVSS